MLRIRVTTLPDRVFEWESPAPEFLIGRADTCALRFEGEAAAVVSWEHAEFEFGPDGLPYLTDLGSTNGTYVDGARIDRQIPIPLRVGSTIQMGRAGPLMEVLAVTRGAAQPSPRPVSAAAPLGATPLRVATPAPATGPAPKSGTQRPGTPNPAAPQWVLLPASAWYQHPAVICGGIALLIAATYLIAERATAPRATLAQPAPVASTEVDPAAGDPAAVNPPAVDLGGHGGGEVKPDLPPIPVVPPIPVATPVPVGTLAPPIATVAPAQPEPQAPADPWKNAGEQAARSLRLIVVEDPKTHASWPFAGATIVGERVLLTTATIAVELSTKFLARGWRVVVMKGSQGEPIAVKDLRVHAAFQQASEAEQLYFDMALVYLGERPGDALPMASAADLAQLETGLTLACVAVDHAGDPLDRFQQLKPKTYPGKLFAMTSLPPQPGGPRLLHLRGSFTDKACGSPIVNEQGRLVALYCEPAQAADSAKGTLAMHYAKVIQPALIELGLNGPDDKVWIPVQPPTSPPASQESSK